MTTMREFIEKAQNVNLYDSMEFRRLCRELDVQKASGASRICAIFPAERMVIKVPRMESCREDYCEREMKNYESAKQYRVERILLPTTFIGENARGCKMYAQPMYDTAMGDFYGRKRDRMVEKLHGLQDVERQQKILEGCFDYCRINRYWCARVTQLYGKKFMRSFEKWTHFAKINDLHEGNVGWLNGKPIILDYAGYFG